MGKLQVALISLTGLLVAAIAAFVLYGGVMTKGGGSGVAQIGGPFTLTDHTGRTRTAADFRGDYLLVYFGYTFCPDVCPTALQSVSNAMDQLDPKLAARIRPIFITVDPQRDTVDQLRSYVGNFHPRMVGLTGTPEQVAQAARAYRVYFARSRDTKEASDYLMDHSSIIFLMGPDGRYLSHFSHGTPIDKMVGKLRDEVG